jgi:hypothetical protein
MTLARRGLLPGALAVAACFWLFCEALASMHGGVRG